MKRAWFLALALIIGFSLVGCGAKDPISNPAPQLPNPTVSDEITIRKLVTDFGTKLQMVSLLAPKEVAAKGIQEHYGSYLSPTLLTKWQGDPEKALGRMTSSPWPDRIEVLAVQPLSVDTYEVKGEIIEVASVEKQNGGAAAKRPVTLTIKKIDNRWLIDSVNLGDYAEAGKVIYKNDQYGFKFTLPDSWKGYTIVTTQWDGLPAGGQKSIATGPMLSIRHPQWTTERPRQDIPMIIFTHGQWEDLRLEKFHIGAAPIGPRELGRNARYVFALPARYNYAFPLGYEEVEQILAANPLQPFELVGGK